MKIELNEVFVFYQRTRSRDVETPKWPEKEQKRQDRAAKGVDNPSVCQHMSAVEAGEKSRWKTPGRVLGKSRLAGCRVA